MIHLHISYSVISLEVNILRKNDLRILIKEILHDSTEIIEINESIMILINWI